VQQDPLAAELTRIDGLATMTPTNPATYPQWASGWGVKDMSPCITRTLRTDIETQPVFRKGCRALVRAIFMKDLSFLLRHGADACDRTVTAVIA
jgi:hypothetical protein